MSKNALCDSAHCEHFPSIFEIDFDGIKTLCCDARKLHNYLHNQRQFADWFKVRVHQYLFEEGRDYKFSSTDAKLIADRRQRDYWLTLEMAKELCQFERSDFGRTLRRYFLNIRQSQTSEIESSDFLRNSVTTLLPSECQTIRELVDKRSGSSGHNAQRLIRSEIWRRIQNQFRVNSYKLIDRRQFADACTFVITLERSTDDSTGLGQPRPGTRKVISAEKKALIEKIIEELSEAVQPYNEIWCKAIWTRIFCNLKHPISEELYEDQLVQVRAMLEEMIPCLVSVTRIVEQVHAEAARCILNNSAQAAPILAVIEHHAQVSLRKINTLSVSI